jgi:hypothetical protein
LEAVYLRFFENEFNEFGSNFFKKVKNLQLLNGKSCIYPFHSALAELLPIEFCAFAGEKGEPGG